MTDDTRDQAGLTWQVGVWNAISDIYENAIDERFAPVVDATLRRAGLAVGERVLDLGTGTGAVAAHAAKAVGPTGRVLAVDISAEMLSVARQRFNRLGLSHVTTLEGRAERIPAGDAEVNVVLASLSLMYVIDRAAAAREIARVLGLEGRFVAAVWAGPEACDIVRFQQTAGQFAGPPPVPGVGPGALADAGEFLGELQAAGVDAQIDTEDLSFEFPSFASAWDALAGVTTAHLPADRRLAAQEAVMAAMYPAGDGPRRFRNLTQFLVGRKVAGA
jgi:SAM-dependent methyltransferase